MDEGAIAGYWFLMMRLGLLEPVVSFIAVIGMHDTRTSGLHCSQNEILHTSWLSVRAIFSMLGAHVHLHVARVLSLVRSIFAVYLVISVQNSTSEPELSTAVLFSVITILRAPLPAKTDPSGIFTIKNPGCAATESL